MIPIQPIWGGEGGGEERGGARIRDGNYGKEKMEELKKSLRITDYISPKYLHVVGMAPVEGGMKVMVKPHTLFWGWTEDNEDGWGRGE